MSFTYILNSSNSSNVLHARIYYVLEEGSDIRTYNIRLFDPQKKEEIEFTNLSIIDLISDITRELKLKPVSGSSKYRKYFPLSSEIEDHPYTPNSQFDLIYGEEFISSNSK